LESADGKLLKGCRDESLSAFSPEDAVTYFHNEGIAATRAEILAACSAYGYHPLSLSLLVGLINEDHAHRGDIEAVKNLEIFEDVRARRHHVLERAYESLAPERRDLLSRISCFRGSMKYAVLKKVFPSPDLDKALLDLRKRGLLQYAGETQRYDLHPIVRHYAYDHFTDEKRRKEAHIGLAKYFSDAMPVTNTKVKTLEDLAPVIELYHHMVGAGNLDEAMKLFYDRIVQQVYYQFGAYQLCIELMRALFIDGEDKPPPLIRDDYQRWTLNTLASAYSLNGLPRRAVPLYEVQNDICEKGSDKKNLAIGLGNAADAQLKIGALSAAERNLRRYIELSIELGIEAKNPDAYHELGLVLSYRGAWQEAKQELDESLELSEKERHVQAQVVTWSYRALHFLLIARSNLQSSIVNLKSSIECAQRALELADETTRTLMNVPRDYVDAYRFLGAAYCASVVSIRRRWSSSPQDVSRPAAYSTTELESLTLAEENLSKALNLCRQINSVDAEADILLDLARLYYAYGSRYASQKTREATRPSVEAEKYFKDAQEKASEALVITERSGYVLQGADVNLFLAQYALEQEKDKAKAKEYAETALKLATCDGPPYYYKVAYDEAERMLASLS
jgi:tetratricopeptide (TPR) repeat protein